MGSGFDGGMLAIGDGSATDIGAFSATRRLMVRNAILGGLSPEEFARIRPHLKRVTFQQRTILQEQRTRIKVVNFIESGLVSLRNVSAENSIEIALAGAYGAVGASVLLGPKESFYQSVALTAGVSLAIEVNELLLLIAGWPQLKERLLLYVHALLRQSSQVAMCGMRHQLERRIAGWLCHASDSVGGAEVPVTHDYLSTQLGLRRAGITEALIRFEGDELITRARGTLRVLDRERLSRRACGCYSVVWGRHRSSQAGQ
jgi:CRP-like cAMP-binding protein